MGLLDLLAGGFIGKLGDIAKIFLGSQAERDKAIAEEMSAVQDAYKSELLAPEKIGFWASMIDGLNRLVRPFFTFGIVAMFVWCVIDPVEFTKSMVALQAVPDMLWYIMLTIIGFWFGGRLLEKIPVGSVRSITAKSLSAILTMQKQIDDLNSVVQPSEPAVETVNSKPPLPIKKDEVANTPARKKWETRRNDK